MPHVFLRTLVVSAVLVTISTCLSAATISGTVKDSSGAIVPGATITITGSAGNPITIQAGDRGVFSSAELSPGKYKIVVHKPGFDDFTTDIELTATSVTLPVVLTVAALHEEVTVSGSAGTYANSDPGYRALRSIGLGKTFQVKDNVVLAYDVGRFAFHHGTLTFLQPVMGRGTGAVFVGDGEFTLTPFLPIDKAELRRRSGSETFTETFSRIVFRFSGPANQSLVQIITAETSTPREVQQAFSDWQDTVRHRNEMPQSMLDSILTGPAMDNVDADLLSCVYNASRPGMFLAYIRGSKHKDLRFFVREHGGAVPQLDSPEETTLINYSPGSLEDGIWYLEHRQSEYQSGTADSREERRFFAARHYEIETVIGHNRHLTSVASIDLQPLIAGERVIKFQLLPNLRVSRVSDGAGRTLYFIQESRKADGSFYVVFPEPCDTGKTYRLRVEYAGDNVIHDAGQGSFYIGARESWYPTPNSFGEKSTYDLTFRVPKNLVLISVGQLKSSTEEDNMAVTHWITPEAVAIAGFNYGAYQHTQLVDDQTKTTIDGYYLPDLPDYLRHIPAAQSLAPGGMTKYALQVTRAELQICNYYFGPDRFKQISITEQPNFNFGQSWPNLVYLPISAYTDATQRYLLFGQISNGFNQFVQEVTPHEVSHQWWGHAVGWASYHDQWLSEGFAEFSASLFIQQGQGPGHDDEYRKFWDAKKRQILEKQNFGHSPNDAGPLWLGLRLESPKNEAGYQYVIYPKGAFVLNMLRSLMYSGPDEKVFADMMHDFVASHYDQPASTESFKAIAEKHITKEMDFQGNGKLDWFFNEWVYGTEVPKYAFSYELDAAAKGRKKAHLTLTQSEVSPNFVMSLPLFAQIEKNRWVRIGHVPIAGSTTRTVDIEVPAAAKALGVDIYHEILQR